MASQWFNSVISRDTALEFFDQLYNFTTEVVINYMPEVANTWPLGNSLHNIHDFEPRGAVVHASYSPSMWNTFHMHTRNAHSAHAIIMSGSRLKRFAYGRYPLLLALPASVLTPHPIMTPLPHSGFMSRVTWGIELRNCGKLRPYDGMSETPPPVLQAEETEDIFRRGKTDLPENYDFFWRGDLWRKKFQGRVYGWEGYYYETPTQEQIETLLIVLLAMNAIAGKMDRRIIIPSNCVHDHIHPIPGVPWTTVRATVTADRIEYIPPPFIKQSYHNSINTLAYEAEDLDYYDEGTIGEQIDIHRWRTHASNGELGAINWGDNKLETIEAQRIRSRPGFRHLRKLSYDTTDLEFALNLYKLSRGVLNSSEEDTMTALMHDV